MNRKTLSFKSLAILTITLLFLLSLAGVNSALAQEEAISATILTDILPIMEKPGMKYKIEDGTLGWQDGLIGAVVYGNILMIRPTSTKGWGEIITPENGKSLGFVPTKGIFKTPAYEPTPVTYYMVAKDNPRLFIDPEERYQQKRLSSFRLLKGEVVPSVGRSGGKLLLRFDTLSGESGTGARHAWGYEGDFIALRSYAPDEGVLDPAWVPSELRCYVYGEEFDPDADSVCPGAKLPDNILKGISSRGFYIDPTPVIKEYLTADDLGDSYRQTRYNTPMFFTTDVFYHFFHLIFNNLLETLELASLAPGLEDCLKTAIVNLANQKMDLPQNIISPWNKAVDMFSVPFALISEKPASVTLGPDATAEVDLVTKAQTDTLSPVTKTRTDYTMFKPRGHYDDSPVLSRYFRSMNYVGTAELTLFDDNRNPIIANIQTAAVVSMALDSLGDKWLALEEPINYLIGASNTGDGKKMRELVKKRIGVLSDPQSLIRLSDENITRALAGDILSEIEGPKIQAVAGIDNFGDNFEKRAPVFRMSGKRFNIDAFIFNQLTSPRVGTNEEPRIMPEGTDVMAVLGSTAATEVSAKNIGILNYDKNLLDLVRMAPSFISDDDTVYSKWLSAFAAHFGNSGSRQFFYNTPAWAYKKLLTTLGSYAEIKHDTILYIEQSMSEGGEGDVPAGDYAPPSPRGYVEPDPLVFEALLAATESLRDFIKKYDLETPKKAVPKKKDQPYAPEPRPFIDRLTSFKEMLEAAKLVAEKEVRGEEISAKDYLNIQSLKWDFDAYLSTGGSEISNTDDLRMALIADIASGDGKVLEAGTGTPRAIYVYVNDKWGGSRLTVGYVFSYYEFASSLSEGRLNDKEWQKIVYDKKRQAELETKRPQWYQNLVY